MPAILAYGGVFQIEKVRRTLMFIAPEDLETILGELRFSLIFLLPAAQPGRA